MGKQTFELNKAEQLEMDGNTAPLVSRMSLFCRKLETEERASRITRKPERVPFRKAGGGQRLAAEKQARKLRPL